MTPLRRFALLPLLLLAAAAHAAPTDKTRDPRLAGTWVVRTAPSSNCEFRAWKTVRSADGKYVLTYYKDTALKKPDGTQDTGTWQTDKGVLTMHSNFHSPNGEVIFSYRYNLTDNDTASFDSGETPEDCVEETRFTEHRQLH